MPGAAIGGPSLEADEATAWNCNLNASPSKKMRGLVPYSGMLELLKQSSVVGKAVKLPHNAPTFPGRAPITAL